MNKKKKSFIRIIICNKWKFSIHTNIFTCIENFFYFIFFFYKEKNCYFFYRKLFFFFFILFTFPYFLFDFNRIIFLFFMIKKKTCWYCYVFKRRKFFAYFHLMLLCVFCIYIYGGMRLCCKFSLEIE